MTLEPTRLLVLLFSLQSLALSTSRGHLLAPAKLAKALLLTIVLLLDHPGLQLLLLAIIPFCSPSFFGKRSELIYITATGIPLLASAAAHTLGWQEEAFFLSLVVLILKSGAWPLHFLMAPVAQDSPARLASTLSTLLPLVLIHLQHLDHLPIAQHLADALVRVGALSTLAAALLALRAATLTEFFRNAVSMHGGILVMTLGAAGNGHYGAALFATVTLCLSTAGLGAMSESLLERQGDLPLSQHHGFMKSYPRLAAFFLFFGAAGVGLPGTAGFVADDLLLHALWQESAWGTAAAILASALLAIATWITSTRLLMGAPSHSRSPDITLGERSLALFCALTLVILGLAPQILMRHANQLLGTPL